MSGHAIQRLVRQSPRKMRLVIDLIRGKDVNEAYAILKFNKKLAAKQIAKTLKSAVSNAEQKALKENASFDVDALFVKKAIVNGGQPLKRFTAAAQGRADHLGRCDRNRMEVMFMPFSGGDGRVGP